MVHKHDSDDQNSEVPADRYTENVDNYDAYHVYENNNTNENNDSDDEVKPPSAFQIALPFVVTALLFWWILKDIEFPQIYAILSQLSFLPIIVAMLVFSLAYISLDILSFGFGFKWFVEPRMPWRHVVHLRASTIFVGVLFQPLGDSLNLLYFYRVWKSSLRRVIAASGVVLVIDLCSTAPIFTILFLFFDTSQLEPIWANIPIMQWGLIIFLFCCCVPLKRFIPDMIRSSKLFSAWFSISAKQVLMISIIRLLVFSLVCSILYYLLMTIGIELSYAQALIFMPLFMTSVFLPISAGGYGGPQGAAILFLDQLWGVATTEQALAYSLLWSTLFLVGRAVVGMILAPPLWFIVKQGKSAI